MQDILFSLLSKKTDQITPRSNFQKHRNQVFPEQQASLPHKIKLILHQRRRVNARPFNGISTIFFHANLACLPPPPSIAENVGSRHVEEAGRRTRKRFVREEKKKRGRTVPAFNHPRCNRPQER